MENEDYSGVAQQALIEEIARREEGRCALIQALVDIVKSATHEQAVNRAKVQLIAAGADWHH
jgi:hypothetical protein